VPGSGQHARNLGMYRAPLLGGAWLRRRCRLVHYSDRRAELAVLDARRDERMAEVEAIGVTELGLEVIAHIDAKREAQQQRIREAEAILAEWTAPADVNQALDFYNALLDVIQGHIKQADGARELNEVLATVLAGMWCELRDGRLLVEFGLRAQARRGSLPPTEGPSYNPGLIGAAKLAAELASSKPGHSRPCPATTPGRARSR